MVDVNEAPVHASNIAAVPLTAAVLKSRPNWTVPLNDGMPVLGSKLLAHSSCAPVQKSNVDSDTITVVVVTWPGMLNDSNASTNASVAVQPPPPPPPANIWTPPKSANAA